MVQLPTHLLNDLAGALIGGDGDLAHRTLQELLGSRAEIQGIALFGSRGRSRLGMAQVVTPASDIDGFVVVRSPALAKRCKDQLRVATGAGDLDLEVVSASQLSTAPKSLAQRFYWHPACVLYDPVHLVGPYLAALSSFVENGPTIWSSAERVRQTSWLERMLRRIELNRSHAALAGYQLCFLKSELLLLARPARGLWGMGPRSTLEWITRTDPSIAELWNQVLGLDSPTSVGRQLELLRQLVDWTLEGDDEGKAVEEANQER